MATFNALYDETPLTCECEISCCHFAGCCTKHMQRNIEPPPYKENYKPVVIQNTDPVKEHAGRISFLDLPGELRNKVYINTVLSVHLIRMRLNPTIMDHGDAHTWGINNKFAILAVCRRLYLEASNLAYKENYFEVVRGSHRDINIPKHLGMPYEQLQFVTLLYPMEASPCSWRLNHMWEHWLNDIEVVQKRFPNLRRLTLKMMYNGFDPNTVYNYFTWGPLFFRLPWESEQDMLDRVVRVLHSLAALYGRRMPPIVQFNWWAFMSNAANEDHPPDHAPYILNKAIVKAANKDADMSKYAEESYPLHWPKDPTAIDYEDEDHQMDIDHDYEGEDSGDEMQA